MTSRVCWTSFVRATLLHRWKFDIRERINYKLGLSGDAVGLREEIMDRSMSTSVGHRRRREADNSKIPDLTIHAKQRSP
jgi:hypothetical protein